MSQVTRAAILAAGKGTRMRGLCEAFPKPLLPIANVPVLELIIRRLKTAGITDVLMVVGHQAEMIEEFFGIGAAFGVNISYVLQSNPKGTGEAALLCEDFAAGGPFMLVFGDILAAATNYPAATKMFAESGADGVLSVWNTPDTSRGASVFVENGRLTKIIEKPKPGTPQSNWDNAGLFIFPPAIFDAVRDVGLSERGEYELTAAIQTLIEQGLDLRALELKDFWFNLTDPETLIEANRCVLGEFRSDGAALVGKGTTIDPRAIIDPLCLIGAGCTIGRARVGHNVSLCDDVVIEDGAELRSCIVLPGSRIGFANVINAVVPAGTVVPTGEHVIGRAAMPGIDE